MKRITFILVAFLFLVNACGPSVEGETKAWDKNVKAMATAKADFPEFATIIDQKLTEAKALWEEAAGITEEEAKADKMSAANNLLSGGCIGNLVGMKAKIKDVDKKLEEVMKLRKGKDGEQKIYAEDAIKDAEKAIKKAKKALKSGSCDDVESRYKKLAAAVTDLTTAITKLSATDKPTTDTTKAADGTSNDTKVDEVKMVKCEYCDTKTPANEAKCKSCGANLK